MIGEEARFSRCLAEVLRLEGGFVNEARDPGGATKYGITLAALSEARGRPSTVQDVELLTPEEAGSIYRARYWAPLRCGDLPAGLDLVAFDAAVNMGPGTSARLLQGGLGIDADGAVGPLTLNAAARCSVPAVIRSACDLRRNRYRNLAGFAAFGAGWLRRVDTVQALALSWAEPVLQGA